MVSIVRAGVALVFGMSVSVASAQTLDPFYAPFYTVINQGTPPGVPGSLGGLTISADDSGVLLIGGNANTLSANVYSVRFTRDSNQRMRAFECGNATVLAGASGNNGGIDGGLAYGPGDVLFYASYPDNVIGQIEPGSTMPDRRISITELGVNPSTGTLMFVPDGFPGAGRLKIASYNASIWYDTSVAPDGMGTYNILPVTGQGIFIGGGPEGIAYVSAGNPGFSADSVLVCEYSGGRVVTYEIDSNGDPIVSTRRPFITGLGGAEGAAIDPLTGDFLFSTFGGGNRVLRVTGFTAINPPGDMNCDGVVSVTDIAGFVLALTNPSGYAAQFPSCDILNADLNENGAVSVGDIARFVEVLTSGTGCDG